MKQTSYYILLLLALGFSACQSKSSGNLATTDIPSLEKALAESNTPQAAQALLDAYEGYIEANPSDINTNSEYLAKAANIHYSAKRYETTADILLQALNTYPQAPNAPQMAARLAQLYEREMEAPVLAQVVWQSLALTHNKVDSIDLTAKTAGLPSIDETMSQMLEDMNDPETMQLRFPVANRYIKASELIAGVAPQLPEAPDYLFKSAEIANYLSMHERALSIFQRIEEGFPNYDKAGMSLFMRAFITEENLQDKESARLLYEEFIRKYPNDGFAEQAQILLDNLDKSNEEIMQEFDQ